MDEIVQLFIAVKLKTAVKFVYTLPFLSPVNGYLLL